MRRCAALTLLMLLLAFTVRAAPTPSALQSPLKASDLDPATFSYWVDGQEKNAGLPADGPQHVIWTQDSAVNWDGVRFGDSKTPGARFLRLGFKSPVPIGTILARSGGQISVLKPGAAYPGRLNVESDWTPAQRITDGVVSRKEANGEDYAVWTLPPGTVTRALRLSHTADVADREYAGWLGGLAVLSTRLANLAPQARAVTSGNPDKAALVNNDSNDGTWNAWENADDKTAAGQPVVSSEHPVYVRLAWPRPVALRGLCALWAGFDAADVQVQDGQRWQTVGTFPSVSSQYPRALGPNWMDFGRTVTARAVRLRITRVTPDAQEGHPHLKGRTVGGRRVWLGELMALAPLGAAPLRTAILPTLPTPDRHPPIAVRFNLPAPGYVTLVIEDSHGKRVRNLISETFFPKSGPNVAWWDGTDDLGRDTEAAHHGLYHVPGQYVAPGTYRVRGLSHRAIDLHYAFSVYNAGSPAWETADGTGGWLTNHTPPQAALFVPGDQAPGGKPLVFLGSYISEGGAGLAWVDLQGRKQGGRGWIGGNWTAAPFLARDAGAQALPGAYAYVGSAFSSDTTGKGEIRLTALTKGGDRPILKYTYDPGDWQKIVPGTGAHDFGADFDGLAVHDGLVAMSLTKQNRLLFVDARLGTITGFAEVPDPRGVALDGQGRLLVLSGTTLLRAAVPASLAAAARLDPQGWTVTASTHTEDAAKATDADPDSRWSTNGPQAPGQWLSVDLGAPRTFSLLTLRTSASRDSPRGYAVAVSGDGKTWGPPIASGAGTPDVTAIAFAPVTARYVRITQTGTAADVYWSVNALDIFNTPARPGTTPQPLAGAQTLVSSGMEDPQGITLDGQGNVYVSDRGASHQVKVFSPEGKLLRAIGHPGKPTTGPYDAQHMNNPHGLTIDSNNHLWVAENDFQPKRVSVWTLEGRFVNAYYGPSRYGGGGTLDPQDKTRFYYDGMEFKLDWKTGENHPVSVFFRPGPDDLAVPNGYGSGGSPETPLYAQERQYMTNCFNSNPTNGAGIALLWRMDRGRAVPVAALGRANDWDLLKGNSFKPRWPPGVDLKGDAGKNATLFAWSDLNDDAHVQPDEVTFLKAAGGGVTVMPDLSFVESRVDEQTVRFAPLRYTPGGAPVYDLAHGQALVTGAQGPISSGGDQALTGPNGWTILTNAPKPFSPYGVGGARNGVPLWTYPSMWPGLHASHESAPPTFPGEMIGTTRLLGGFVTPKAGDAGPLWCINGNQGDMYLMTADGLFVSQLFQDIRRGKTWSMPSAPRGLRVNDVSLHDENFWPTITQTSDGQVYLNSSLPNIVRVDGLETIRRIPPSALQVTPAVLKQAQAYVVQSEALRQKAQGTGVLTVALRTDAPVVDGLLDDWAGAEWATVDKSGVVAYFDSNSRPYDVSAAVAVAGDRLYAAWRTGDPDLLRNTGQIANAPFKTGGALDLMLAANGTERLLITQVSGKTRALLYRAHVPGTNTPVPFSSPSRTITLDRVDDMSDDVQLAGKDGGYEISVPLARLGLTPTSGRTVRGDIGILRGNGFQTVQRVYWSNKATGITADVPSEAELTPQLWGLWAFK